MSWNAAHYQELSEVAPRLQLAAPLGYMPLLDAALPWVEVVGGYFSLKSFYKAVIDAGERKRKQREFWVPILSPEELRSHLVICGGRRSAFADQVRRKIHPKASGALLELLVPPFLQTLHPFQSAAFFVEGLLSQPTIANKIESLGSLVSKALVSSNNAPVQLMHKVQFGRSKLLLPLGGQVSNSLVEQQVRETQRFRKLRVVAVPSENSPACELTTVNEMAAVRRKKAALIRGVPDTEEHVVLDNAIRYELWKNMEPVARPHFESFESERATDYAYVVLSRLPNQEAILSVQALHVLGLAAMSLFYSPIETLGNDAQSFREHALSAMRAPRSVGFESILKIQRAPTKLAETPRHFDGQPAKSNQLTISMHVPPSSICS